MLMTSKSEGSTYPRERIEREENQMSPPSLWLRGIARSPEDKEGARKNHFVLPR